MKEQEVCNVKVETSSEICCSLENIHHWTESKNISCFAFI